MLEAAWCGLQKTADLSGPCKTMVTRGKDMERKFFVQGSLFHRYATVEEEGTKHQQNWCKFEDVTTGAETRKLHQCKEDALLRGLHWEGWQKLRTMLGQCHDVFQVIIKGGDQPIYRPWMMGLGKETEYRSIYKALPSKESGILDLIFTTDGQASLHYITLSRFMARRFTSATPSVFKNSIRNYD